MICEKCGHEFLEGRNCPECGALAIFVKDDEYQERKQEWEEENAPKEDQIKKKLNIHISPAIIKKAVISVAVVCVIATAIFWIVGTIREFFVQQQFTVVYDMGNSMNADKGSFEVYSVESAVYSADGNYVYKDEFDKSGVEGEIISICTSTSGDYGALVSRVGDEVPEYYLYTLGENCERIRVSTGKIDVVEVTSDGEIYFLESELGAYDVVLGTAIYMYNGEKCKLIAEDVGDFEACENEDEFIYYDSELQAYLYDNGENQPLREEEYGYEFARTATGVMYYVNGLGELYLNNKKSPADSGILAGTLNVIANSDKVTYVKDGKLYCYGKSMKNPIVLVEEYDLYGEKAKVVEKHDKIYCAYNGRLIVTNKKGKIYSEKDGIEGVYLCK